MRTDVWVRWGLAAVLVTAVTAMPATDGGTGALMGAGLGTMIGCMLCAGTGIAAYLAGGGALYTLLATRAGMAAAAVCVGVCFEAVT